VGFEHVRRGYVVTGVLGYSKVGAGALVFSKSGPDSLPFRPETGRIGEVPSDGQGLAVEDRISLGLA